MSPVPSLVRFHANAIIIFKAAGVNSEKKSRVFRALTEVNIVIGNKNCVKKW
jgi:hypothetical protein